MSSIDTEMPQNGTQSKEPQPESAPVLRRNQACLACRRRKLKCDAIRPACSTCVRSYKHLLRTSPKSNPVMQCHYDDEQAPAGKDDSVGHSNSPISIEDDDTEGGRKKRKSNSGDVKKKKPESEAEKLKRKIEMLEAQLADKNGPMSDSPSSRKSSGMAPPPPKIFSNGPPAESAQSPTAFLEMLSSAATAQGPSANRSQDSVPAGLRFGASGSTMMNGATGTYFATRNDNDYMNADTPIFVYSENQTQNPNQSQPQQQQQQQRPDIQTNGSSSESSRPSSSAHGVSPFTSGSGTSAEPIALTPNGIFNFSPGPSGPAGYDPIPIQNVEKIEKMWNSQDPIGRWRAPDTAANFVQPGNQPWVSADSASFNMNGQAPGPQIQNIPNISNSAPLPPVQEEFPPLDEAIQQQLLMDLFWPGWPPGLPEPHIVNDLVEAFVQSVPSLPRLLHKTRFQTRLTLPPTHSNFPHPALLHSMCSIASNWCAPAIYEKSTMGRTLDEKSGKEMSFPLRQASLAKEMVHDGLNTGNRMFDVVRAMMILSRIFIDDTRMLECWAYNGLVARMILPLGLNVRSAELSLKSVMLPPPADALEREERRAAMWFAFYHDTIASTASGWGTSIALDELSVPLPVGLKDWDSGSPAMQPNLQDLDSYDLYTNHPVVDPYVMVIKASILINRASKFARKWKNRHLRPGDDFEGMNRPEFREIANGIACFQMSFPYELRNPTKLVNGRLDIDLIASHMIPHAAIICLYEPFADITDPADQAARRILAAAQATVGIVQQLAAAFNDGTTNFTSVMHSAASVCLVTAARTCLIFYRHALNIGDDSTATSIKSDIEMIRMALSQFGQKFKIGHHHAQLVEYFLDRSSYPTYEKLSAHYPEHPRPGAVELTPNSHFGVCVLNALNVKRGYWRLSTIPGIASSSNNSAFSPNGISPTSNSTPVSQAAGVTNPCPTEYNDNGKHRRSDGGLNPSFYVDMQESMNSLSDLAKDSGGARIESESPISASTNVPPNSKSNTQYGGDFINASYMDKDGVWKIRDPNIDYEKKADPITRPQAIFGSKVGVTTTYSQEQTGDFVNASYYDKDGRWQIRDINMESIDRTSSAPHNQARTERSRNEATLGVPFIGAEKMAHWGDKDGPWQNRGVNMELDSASKNHTRPDDSGRHSTSDSNFVSAEMMAQWNGSSQKEATMFGGPKWEVQRDGNVDDNANRVKTTNFVSAETMTGDIGKRLEEMFGGPLKDRKIQMSERPRPAPNQTGPTSSFDKYLEGLHKPQEDGLHSVFGRTKKQGSNAGIVAWDESLTTDVRNGAVQEKFSQIHSSFLSSELNGNDQSITGFQQLIGSASIQEVNENESRKNSLGENKASGNTDKAFDSAMWFVAGDPLGNIPKQDYPEFDKARELDVNNFEKRGKFYTGV